MYEIYLTSTEVSYDSSYGIVGTHAIQFFQ